MARQKKTFSPEFKMQVVLESFQTQCTLTQLASHYHVSINNIENWKKQFLQNAHLAFNTSPSAESIETLKKENLKLEKMLEKTYEETKNAAEKLKKLDLNTKKQLIDTASSPLSIAQQCKIIDLNRPSLYYESKSTSNSDDTMMQKICEIYNRSQGGKGYRAIHKKLVEEGFKIGVNKVYKLMKILEEQNALAMNGDRELLQEKPQAHVQMLHHLALVKPFKL